VQEGVAIQSPTGGARPDQTHVAAQHVDDLRQLVQAGFAEDAANPCDTRIAVELQRFGQLAIRAELGQPLRSQLLELGFSIRDHRAEFIHIEAPTTQSGALLHKKDRTAAIEKDQQHQNQHQGHGDRGAGNHDGDIDQALEDGVDQARAGALIRQLVDPEVRVVRVLPLGQLQTRLIGIVGG